MSAEKMIRPSKSKKCVAASVDEKNKKKLKNAIAVVVKALPSLNSSAQNEELQILQRQLLMLNKKLAQQKPLENIEQKVKNRKSKKHIKSFTYDGKKDKNIDGYSLGSHIVLPLGVSATDTGCQAQKIKKPSSKLFPQTSKLFPQTSKPWTESDMKLKKKRKKENCDYIQEMKIRKDRKKWDDPLKSEMLNEIMNEKKKDSKKRKKKIEAASMESRVTKEKRILMKKKNEPSGEKEKVNFSEISSSLTSNEKFSSISNFGSCPKGSIASHSQKGSDIFKDNFFFTNIEFSPLISLSEKYYFLSKISEFSNSEYKSTNQKNHKKGIKLLEEKNKSLVSKIPIQIFENEEYASINSPTLCLVENKKANFQKTVELNEREEVPSHVMFSPFVSLSEQYYNINCMFKLTHEDEKKSPNPIATHKSKRSKRKHNVKTHAADDSTKLSTCETIKEKTEDNLHENIITNVCTLNQSEKLPLCQDIVTKQRVLPLSKSVSEKLVDVKKKKKKKAKKEKAELSFNSFSYSPDKNMLTLCNSEQIQEHVNVEEKNKADGANKKIKNPDDANFEDYFTEDEISNGLENKNLVTGHLRINSKDYTLAYVSSEKCSEQDYLIEGIRNRNRALEGDVVVLSVLPEDKWKVISPSIKQKTARVVYIKEMVHSRHGVGTLKRMVDKNTDFALFSPKDSRLPRLRVPMYSCPSDFYLNAQQYQNTYFEAILISWPSPKIAHGFVTQELGLKGEIETETISLLGETDCDVTPIPLNIFESCSQDIIFDENIFKNRQDLRLECIFSIDPEGAKDLDDALSCKKLPNGNFEIGVHISDVAFYIKQGTPFDKAVCRKATTIYLVQKAFHMLPQELCYLCSLTPGEDKLAFSVFWEMTEKAVIVSHRFTRSIIHSCCQLTYSHAQKVIESHCSTDNYNFPPIFNGFTERDIAEKIIQLHNLASILRKNRFDEGALRIDIPKLWFNIDSTSCMPTACHLYPLQESNWMIEEFMLLANFTVGRHIYNAYPDISLLRSHKEPKESAMIELKRTLETLGVPLDISSGAAIFKSINQWEGDSVENVAAKTVLSNLCAKPMPKALYFSSGMKREKSDFWHYALNKGFYTHFTSPIRRYADIVVHRLLAASLGYCSRPDHTPEELQKVADNCNTQKFRAKRAGELSSNLFLTYYVRSNGPFIEKAAVLDVKDHSFDCVILRFSYIARVYTNNLKKEAEVVHSLDGGIDNIFILWKENPQKNIKHSIQLIRMFSLVTIELTAPKADLKLEAKLLPFC